MSCSSWEEWIAVGAACGLDLNLSRRTRWRRRRRRHISLPERDTDNPDHNPQRSPEDGRGDGDLLCSLLSFPLDSSYFLLDVAGRLRDDIAVLLPHAGSHGPLL